MRRHHNAARNAVRHPNCRPLTGDHRATHPAGTGVATLSLGRGDLKVNCAICRTTDQTSWAADATVCGWINARTTLGGELGA